MPLTALVVGLPRAFATQFHCFLGAAQRSCVITGEDTAALAAPAAAASRESSVDAISNRHSLVLAGCLLATLAACPSVLGPSRADQPGRDGGAALDAGGDDAGGSDAAGGDATFADMARDDLALPGCSGARTLCGDECVDLQTDPRFCGSCDRSCDTGEVCAGGQCSAGGDCREAPCTGFTYCDQTSGDCLPGCDRDQQCGANEYCNTLGHDCYCDWGFHDCGGVCVDDGSAAHCGTSCAPCPTDPHGDATCASGQCGVSCDVNFHLCDGVCVSDLAPEHCGARCAPCPTGPSGVPACVAGQCTLSCEAGTHLCGAACVTDDHVDHCGERCTPCPEDLNGAAVCAQGLCGLSCDPGFHLCGDSCVSDDDPATCGDRCSPCPTDLNGDATCANDACVLTCHDGHRLCDGACDSCPAYATQTMCWEGACVASACDAGRSPCASGCCSWQQRRYWEDAGSPTSIAIGHDGEPQVSFYDYSDPDFNELYRGFSYESVEPVTSGAMAGDSQIRIRLDGQPVLAFHDETADDIKLVTRANSYSEWVTTDAVTEGSVGEGLAMVLDGEDMAHLSYYDTSYSEVHYAVQHATGWDTEIVATMVGDNACDTAIRLDGSGRPVIAYRDADQQTVAIATLQGSVWQLEYLDNHGGDSGYGVDLEIDEGGALHLVYTVGTPGSYIYYATNAPGTWETTSLTYRINSNTSGPGVASLALDSAGEPHVALTVRGSGTPAGCGVRYARPLWGGWTTSIVDYWWFSRPRIAMDADDVPFIVTTRSDFGILFVSSLRL